MHRGCALLRITDVRQRRSLFPDPNPEFGVEEDAMCNKTIAITAGAALLLSGCSSRPRQFSPVLAAPPADAAAYDEAYRGCRAMVAETSAAQSRGRLASGGAAVAAGVGAGAVGAAATGGTYASYGAAAAAGGAVIMAVPFFGVAAAWGLAKAKKSRNERVVKEATGACLRDRGYVVSAWVKEKKSKRARPSASEVAVNLR